jgi:hypothetical protein
MLGDKWEYKIMRFASQDKLNMAGAEGWEAVAIFKDNDVLMKKPVDPYAQQRDAAFGRDDDEE